MSQIQSTFIESANCKPSSEAGCFGVDWRWRVLEFCVELVLRMKKISGRVTLRRENIPWTILHLKKLARSGGFIFQPSGDGRVEALVL